MGKYGLKAAAALLIFLSPVDALSCVCISKPPAESLQEAGAVFSGKIVALRATEVVVQVEKVWKGQLPESFTLYVGSRNNTCNYRFERGEKYLIYAVEHPNGGGGGPALKASKCLGTKKLRHAEKDLQEFEKVAPPK
jgi:hypothetical protein